MLQIGYKELSDEGSNQPLLSDDEYRTEYSIFCLLAAPLIMSNDLTRWTPAMTRMLLNPEMIALDQDPLGVSGRVVYNTSGNLSACNHTHPQDTYSTFLEHNLCNDTLALLGGAGASKASVGACAEWCAADDTEAGSGCRYFGFSPKEHYCLRYNASCVARTSSAPADQAPSYTVYKLNLTAAAGRGGGGVSPPAPCWDPSAGGGMGIQSRTPNPNMLVVYARPLHDGAVAVGLMNRDTASNHTISLALPVIGIPAGTAVKVRDMWGRQDQDPRLVENGGSDSGMLSRVVCGHCTEVLKVSRVDGKPIPWNPWHSDDERLP